MCDRLGYSREEMLTMPVAAINLPESATLIRERIEQIMQGGVQVYEATHIRRDGTMFPIEAVARRVEFRGSPAILTVVRDITKRCEAEQALRQSEDRFWTLFEHANDAIFVRDLGGKILEANRTACQRLGYSREELLAMSLAEVEPPEIAPLVAVRTEEILSRGSAFFESIQVRRDGTVIPVEISAAVIEFDHRKAIVSIAHDIDERRQAQAERASR